MSTLRITNIEAKADPSSPTVDEKIKLTNSNGDILVHIDGKTSGITTIGINTTAGNIKFDQNSNVVVTGIITATKFVGTIEPTSLEIGSNIKLGNAGVITATSYVGDGSALTGITGTTINNNANNRVITGSGTANTLEGEANLTYDGTDLVLNGSGDKALRWATGGTNKWSLYHNNGAGALVAYDNANNAERLRIDSSGNLGLGESSSIDARLHVNSGTDNTTLFLESTDGDVNLCMADNAGSCRLLQAGGNLRFRTGGNANAFGTGDSERMVLDSSGRLLLGTTASASGRLLHINNSGSSSAYFHSTNDNSGTGSSDGIVMGMGDATNAYFWNYESGSIQFATSGTARMTLDSSGRLLLGTTTEGNSAADDLTIATTGSTGITIRSGTSGNGNVFFADGTSGDAALDGYIQYQHANRSLKIGTAATERLRIDSSGNVGINNTAPADKLHVGGNIRFGTNTTYYGVIEHDAPTTGANIYTSKDTGGHIFKTGLTPTEKVRITNSGQLLLQTTNSTGTQLIKVNGDTNGTTYGGHIALTQGRTTPGNGATHGVLSFGTETRPEVVKVVGFVDGTWTDGQYHPSGLYIATTDYNRNSPTEKIRITDIGEINCYSSGACIQAGTLQGGGYNVYFYEGRRNQNTGGTRTYIVWSNGNVENTNNSYGSISDQRLKENIVDATSQWDDIKSLQIRKYNFREATGNETHTQIGLIAQEVESVSPGLVHTTAVSEGDVLQDADGNQMESVKSINYSVLYMKSVKALQEAQTRIEALEAAVAALQGS